MGGGNIPPTPILISAFFHPVATVKYTPPSDEDTARAREETCTCERTEPVSGDSGGTTRVSARVPRQGPQWAGPPLRAAR